MTKDQAVAVFRKVTALGADCSVHGRRNWSTSTDVMEYSIGVESSIDPEALLKILKEAGIERARVSEVTVL